MTDPTRHAVVAFAGTRRLADGLLPEVARHVRAALDAGETEPILVFDAVTAQQVDLDLRGTPDEVAARVLAEGPPPRTPGPGRPRLGVVSREVSLLPRHWDWLASQPGGASAVLRRLVEEARRQGGEAERARLAREASYRFMNAMAGNLEGFEEACRAQFAGRLDDLEELTRAWPPDVRDQALALARGAGG